MEEHKGSFITLSYSNITYNRAKRHGGVVFMHDCTITADGCNFIDNGAKQNGGVFYVEMSSLWLNESRFQNNKAHRGGVMYTIKSNIDIDNCSFTFNKAGITGGSLFLYDHSNTAIKSSTFSDNSASSFGGALSAFSDSKVHVHDKTTFQSNSAYCGGAIFVHGATEITCSGAICISDNTAEFGVFGVFRSKAIFLGNTSFVENNGSLLTFSGDLSISGNVTFLKNEQYLWDSGASESFLRTQEGGAITLLLSNLAITGTVTLSNNLALISGGGILVMTSSIIQRGELRVKNNSATDSGGGIYLYQSVVFIQGITEISENKADNYGGGIHAVSSTIICAVVSKLSNNFYIQQNLAKYGGGAYLEVYSKFHFTPLIQLNTSQDMRLNTLAKFINNTANYGGAIFVADNTSIGTCLGSMMKTVTVTVASQSECFFQVTKIRTIQYTLEQAFYFEGNYAAISGSHLYGGLLDRCTTNTFQKKHTPYSSISKYSDNFLEHTSSDPVRVCLCNKDVPICGHKSDPQKVVKGEKFSLNIAVIDQVSHVMNATVNAYLSDKSSHLAHGQYTQTVGATCARLSYTITSTNDYEELVLYAQGPCSDLGISPLKLTIEFTPCYCPVGFEELKTIRNRCVCTCHKKLLQLTFIDEKDCNSTRLFITRNSDFWISTENTTNLSFVSAEECPLLYCLPYTAQVSISLDSPNGADAQCNFNRSGKLCSKCQEGLSLSLGSSHCVSCPDYWYAVFMITITGAFLAGLALVTLMLISNLTVASGTLNGLIFYANVFSANKSLFMPFRQTNLHSIFIDWLNLDIGINFCFINGMDAYTKAWLEFAFPIYIILIVVAVIVVSKHSAKFAKLIAWRNPVATLATLILLSYAKLLNTIIISLSYVTLLYTPVGEGGSYHEKVWLYDASVLYFSGKHIPLFIASSLVFTIVFIYTFFLLSWQWLVQLPDNKIVRSTKLSSFMDAYHAPYTARNRYWTGLLLLARGILYLISAINISGKPSVNLLAFSLVIGGILLLNGYSGIRIYKKWVLNVFEFTSYFNILAFTVVKFYVLQGGGDHIAIAYTSISIELVVFLCIIVYHTATETNILKRIRHAGWYKAHFSQDLRVHLLNQEERTSKNQHVTISEVGITTSSESQRDREALRERDEVLTLFVDQ